MKVFIGKPKSGYSLYGWLRHLFGAKVADSFFKWENTKLYIILDKFVQKHLNSVQKVSIQIDPWDCWSADYTLALIILPVLEQVRLNKQGVPSQFLPGWEYTEEEFAAAQMQWESCLDKMVLAFRHIVDDNEPSEVSQYEQIARETNEGLMLFAKHYRSLWT